MKVSWTHTESVDVKRYTVEPNEEGNMYFFEHNGDGQAIFKQPEALAGFSHMVGKKLFFGEENFQDDGISLLVDY